MDLMEKATASVRSMSKCRFSEVFCCRYPVIRDDFLDVSALGGATSDAGGGLLAPGNGKRYNLLLESFPAWP